MRAIWTGVVDRSTITAILAPYGSLDHCLGALAAHLHLLVAGYACDPSTIVNLLWSDELAPQICTAHFRSVVDVTIVTPTSGTKIRFRQFNVTVDFGGDGGGHARLANLRAGGHIPGRVDGEHDIPPASESVA